jgi:hypothetical protein
VSSPASIKPMSTVRKLAREAVIFMLLGPVVAVLVFFVLLNRQSIAGTKAEAAQSLFAIDAAQEPAGFRPVNSVLIPLTNGTKLYVTDCSQAHPIDWFEQNAPNKSAVARVRPGAHGGDCVYFNDPSRDAKYGLQMAEAALGNENQVAIEKEYWQAYAKAKSQHRIENATAAAVLSLWGFPGGLILWVFYRLVRFAVKG